jgi:hypothetical protein
MTEELRDDEHIRQDRAAPLFMVAADMVTKTIFKLIRFVT